MRNLKFNNAFLFNKTDAAQLGVAFGSECFLLKNNLVCFIHFDLVVFL